MNNVLIVSNYSAGRKQAIKYKKDIQKLLRKFMKLKVKFYYNILSENKIASYPPPKIFSPVLFMGRGKITIAPNAYLGYYPSNYFWEGYSHIEAREEDAEIIIKEGTIINNKAAIVANKGKITIGKDCRIGVNFCCINSDFHGLKVKDRDNPDAVVNKDINIGNNVFIGSDVTVLKGVTIGDGAVIGARSVVCSDLPSNCICGGFPAKVIREIEN